MVRCFVSCGGHFCNFGFWRLVWFWFVVRGVGLVGLGFSGMCWFKLGRFTLVWYAQLWCGVVKRPRQVTVKGMCRQEVEAQAAVCLGFGGWFGFGPWFAVG